MPYLTQREKEAFYRGQAAGIIPADCPVPQTGEEIDGLIQHVGPMCSRTVGCRNRTGKLFFVDISVFSQKHLEATVRRLPELLAEVSEVTPLQIEKYDVSLNELANYFSLGRDIIDEEDIAARFPPLTVDDIRKGFDFKYEPVKIPDYASDEQRMALSDRIIQGKNRRMTCREWENLTGTKAAELLRHSDWPQETISERVRLLADEYLKLTQEERILFFETIKQRTKA